MDPENGNAYWTQWIWCQGMLSGYRPHCSDPACRQVERIGWPVSLGLLHEEFWLREVALLVGGWRGMTLCLFLSWSSDPKIRSGTPDPVSLNNSKAM